MELAAPFGEAVEGEGSLWAWPAELSESSEDGAAGVSLPAPTPDASAVSSSNVFIDVRPVLIPSFVGPVANVRRVTAATIDAMTARIHVMIFVAVTDIA